MQLPPGSCDAHCHIFGPPERFPYRSDRTYEPPAAPLEAYQSLQAKFGLSRAVFVQPAVYGSDHRAMIDAMARGDARYRGVGLVADTTSDAELDALHDAGLRGARFNFVGHLGTQPDIAEVRRTGTRVGKLGWHIVLHVDGPALVRHGDDFAALGCDFVIDHMARLSADDGTSQPHFVRLLELAQHPRCWIKISAGDRMVRDAARLGEALPFMQALTAAAPDRTLWGTDWPHPNTRFMPDDCKVLELLFEAVPDRQAREAILVNNPARLYGFETEARP
jgi:predicted TIM-barrel fold metal-dependent hydrolase